MTLVDRIGQVIYSDSTILYLGDKQIYEVEGVSAQKIRVRIRKNRISSLWPENCLVIDENLWHMAREQAKSDIAQHYWKHRRNHIEGDK